MALALYMSSCVSFRLKFIISQMQVKLKNEFDFIHDLMCLCVQLEIEL